MNQGRGRLFLGFSLVNIFILKYLGLHRKEKKERAKRPTLKEESKNEFTRDVGRRHRDAARVLAARDERRFLLCRSRRPRRRESARIEKFPIEEPKEEDVLFLFLFLFCARVRRLRTDSVTENAENDGKSELLRRFRTDFIRIRVRKSVREPRESLRLGDRYLINELFETKKRSVQNNVGEDGGDFV